MDDSGYFLRQSNHLFNDVISVWDTKSLRFQKLQAVLPTWATAREKRILFRELLIKTEFREKGKKRNLSVETQNYSKSIDRTN